jgi:hypothetical protein
MLRTTGCRPSLASKLVGGGYGGNQRRDVATSRGCVEANQLRVERVTVRSIFEELVYFAPTEWIGYIYLEVVYEVVITLYK